MRPYLLAFITTMLFASRYASATIINADDRRIRATTGTEFEPFESAQGRFWCLIRGKAPKGVPTHAQLLGGSFSVENAILFVDKDLILTNRHPFTGPTHITPQKMRNCWFEHIQTGRLTRLSSDVAYPPQKTDSLADIVVQDIAIVRLEKEVTGGTPIRLEDLALDLLPETERPLTVLSNFALNFQPWTALTITTCHSRTPFILHDKLIYTIGTDCDSGKGSSGSQVYIHDRNGQVKLYGLISGEAKESRDGDDYIPNRNGTLVVTFEGYITDLYHQVRTTAPLTTVQN